MTLPIATTEDMVVMQRASFDEIVRVLETAGVNVEIVRATPELQAAFDDAIHQ